MVRFLLIIFSVLLSSQLYAAECGLFRVVKGNVTYKQKDKDSFSKARINKKVCQGDTVKTDADARAKIVMADANELNISPSSELLIEVYNNAANGEKQVLLDVVYGKVRSNVKQKYDDSPKSHYRVKTKSAVAGVRGTEFMASFNAATSESRIVTFKGEVMVGELKGGQFVAQISVKPGQFTSNRVGTNPHPAKEVPPQELVKMNQESNVSDSPRSVSGEAAKSEVKKDDVKKEDPKNNKNPDSTNKDDKKSPGTSDKNSDGKSNSKGKSPSAAAPANGKGPNSGATSGSRGVASVQAKDSLGLPPANLDNMPKTGNLGGLIPIPIIPMVNPILPTMPTCPTCDNAVVNQKVQVTIVVVPPGG